MVFYSEIIDISNREVWILFLKEVRGSLSHQNQKLVNGTLPIIKPTDQSMKILVPKIKMCFHVSND